MDKIHLNRTVHLSVPHAAESQLTLTFQALNSLYCLELECQLCHRRGWTTNEELTEMATSLISLQKDLRGPLGMTPAVTVMLDAVMQQAYNLKLREDQKENRAAAVFERLSKTGN